MQRWINLLDEQYDVKVQGCTGKYFLQVADGPLQPSILTKSDPGNWVIQLGDQSARIKMIVRGDTAYIRAFDRTFTLHIIDPVEQAARNVGDGSNKARAPMPGVVVETEVTAGDQVTKGQPMITIESMKMLMVITAPMSGEVLCVHFEPGQAFDKNAILVSLTQVEEN
jgi:biotin carboxyl carrier protein